MSRPYKRKPVTGTLRDDGRPWRKPFSDFVQARMERLSLSPFDVNTELGFEGRSVFNNVLYGIKALDLERVEGLADILRLKGPERRRLWILAVCANQKDAAAYSVIRDMDLEIVRLVRKVNAYRDKLGEGGQKVTVDDNDGTPSLDLPAVE